MIGKTVSHYKILEKLGEGGMGVVYKAEDLKLTRTVALKFLPHGLDAHGPERERFLQEARAAAVLNHPNICTVYDIQEHEGRQFIVMEYVEGKTLREIVPVKKMKDAITYAVQIAEALQEAHSKGIVHRDIKAENIMVNAKNQVKVMDFGLAKLKGSLKLTRTSGTIGTLAYMAPEQIQGGVVDARSDIFSFGVVLYELAAGHLPFRGEHEAAMVYSIVNEEPEPLQHYVPEAPSELLHILDRALEKDPEERYQSAHEMSNDLRRALKQSGRVSPSASASVERMLPTGKKRITTVGKAWKSTTAVLAGIVIVVTAVFFWTRYHTSSETIPFKNRKIIRLTDWGQAAFGTISPDGRFVACVRSTQDSTTLCVLQVDAPVQGALQLVSSKSFLGITSFSRDGLSLYFGMQTGKSRLPDLYRVPVLGGQATLVLRSVSGPATFSPDGSRMAFMRNLLDPPSIALIIAHADGTNQQTLSLRKPPDMFSSWGWGDAPAWSPDSRTLAVPAGSHAAFGVLLVSVNDGSTSWLSSQQWIQATQLTWMPDGSGILLSGKAPEEENPQLWYVSYPEGKVSRVTDDLQIYGNLSLSPSRDGKRLVTTIGSGNRHLWVAPYGHAGVPRQLTTGFGGYEGESGVAVASDGTVVFTSETTGNRDIWIVNSDGSNRRRLTTGKQPDLCPQVTGDGRQIVFVSVQSGLRNIWRMDIDGTNLKQLTFDGGDAPEVALDGTVFYTRSETTWAEIWKVPISGGTPAPIGRKSCQLQAVSRDGKLMAFSPFGSAKTIVVPTNGGEPVATFDDLGAVKFGPDGRFLLYEKETEGSWQLWEQPIPLGKGRKVLSIDLPSAGNISPLRWALTHDGKNVVYSLGVWQEDIYLFAELD